ncbi:MAG: glycosyltransferase [Phycisphaerales bacterium]|nr:glycosyltransferase [Phycisphaerales bacterium]
MLRHHREFDVLVEDFTSFAPIFSTLLARTPALLQVQIFSSKALLRRFGVLAPIFRLSQKRYPTLHRHAVYLTPQLAARWPYSRQQQRFHIGMGIPERFLTSSTARKSYILYLGRLSYLAKGLDVLADASPHIFDMFPEMRLVIAGKGPDEAEVRSRFAPLLGRYPDRISFPGFVSGFQKEQLLANCDALVMPSREEGEGLCVTEAAAFGKPTIASDIQELKYVGENGIGINTATNDSAAFALAVQGLLSTGGLYDSMSTRARQWAAQRTWNHQARQFESALQTTVVSLAGSGHQRCLPERDSGSSSRIALKGER